MKVANFIYVCEISSSHGGEYDVQSCLLGFTALGKYFIASRLVGGGTTPV
jgi:hypothetical protein